VQTEAAINAAILDPFGNPIENKLEPIKEEEKETTEKRRSRFVFGFLWKTLKINMIDWYYY